MFKYCPKCQSSDISFEGQRYWDCGNCDFVYFHNTAAGVAGLIKYRNQLLFTVRAKNPEQGKLDLPGGFVDYHETLEQGLSRELTEELSLTIAPQKWQYFCSFPNQYLYKNINYHTIDSVFACELDQKPEVQLEKAEIQEARWIALDEIDVSKIAFPSLANAVTQFIEME
ncbi:NUDIX domain-containing protein [Aliiglaciecola sp. 3_MG-2023]|uniref:NUDIX hydrolase n=1 Tax=Aliiglaciecola sp. 3_MG-2023 TaxID=3062644 RepID=UPI0026E3F1CF|nr:NUDIX domain-containing protein [Aliiglaciecola sp. 3_MG-2023]MDO6695416.1 NUDIX domain-containing protein [Aliiglaciecola sp. 3_MG-2023]